MKKRNEIVVTVKIYKLLQINEIKILQRIVDTISITWHISICRAL